MPSIAIFFSDSPSSQYRNKTIFKLISHHKEYFGLEATWSYFEVRHGKGPCDSIGGTAKRQADMAVRHGKVIIQEAADFYSWASSERGCIDYLSISFEDYEESENILPDLMVNIQAVKDTTKGHADQRARYGEHPATASTAQVSVTDGERSNLLVGKLNKQVNDF